MSRYVEDVWADTDHLRSIPVDGSPSAVYLRLARFAKASFPFEPVETAVLLGVLLVFTVGSSLFPLAGLTLWTVTGVVAYRAVGVRRRSLLLSFPSLSPRPPS